MDCKGGDFLQKLIPHLMDVWEHPELVGRDTVGV